MKIAYVKIRKDKDPVLQMLRLILPEDKVVCADISAIAGTVFNKVKMGNIIRRGRPDLLVTYGDGAAHVLRAGSSIPAVIIDPSDSIKDDMLDFYMNAGKDFIIRTGLSQAALDAETLSSNICPVIESLRKEANNNAILREELIEMAMIKTDASPDDFDGNDDITDNLRRHMDTAELSTRLCPDCGQRMINFYVCSPPETWAHLCGRAGRLTYCPMCKTQHGFFLQFMN